jgi:ATP/maltotriose-dependent transcriptional regulator MalT/DNA-binding SARP family transcriptional activator
MAADRRGMYRRSLMRPAPAPQAASGARNKAVPPPLIEPIVERSGLLRKLDEAMRRRLTLVIADAGFGKTTMLASWAATQACAWYTVTATDAEVGALAGGLVDALSVWVPALRSAVRGLVSAGRGPDADADRPTRAVAHAALVADALDRHLARDLALVIDDLSEIDPKEPTTRFVEALVRMAPPRLHLVLADRSQPAFPIERLRGRGQVLTIDGTSLALSEEETGALISALLGVDDAELSTRLHAATGGWPAAVRMAAEALRSVAREQRLATLDRILQPAGPVAAYLAEEAVARSSPEVRHLLQVVAPLERFSPELCASLGVTEAERLLPELAGRGLLVLELGGEGGWYGLAPLVRDLMLTAATPGGPSSRATLRRAATWYLRQGEWLGALGLLDASGDRRATSVLEEHGAALVAAGEVDAVLRAIQRVEGRGTSPLIDQLEGEARQVRGDWDGALRCFQRIASERGPIPAGVAWRMGLIHHLRGDLGAALVAYARGRSAHSADRDAAMLHAWWASALWLRGDVEGCRRLAERSLAEARAADDDSALAAAHTVLAMLAALDSDRRSNDAHYLRALEHATRANDVLQTIRIRANRGSRFAEEGYYQEALTELDEAIRLADLAGFAAFRALALSNRGQVLLALGRLDEAVNELEAARALYQRMDSRLVAYPLGHLGEVYRERGDMALARANFEEAIAVAEAAGDQQGLVPAMSGLARVLVRSEPRRAAALAERAIEAGPVLGRGAALLAAGWVALARGEHENARERADQAAKLARQRRDRSTLASSLELMVRAAPDPSAEADRLDEALALWRDLGSPIGIARVELAVAELMPPSTAAPYAEQAREASRRLGAWRLAGNAARLLNHIAAQPPAPVELRSLGGFEVLREERSVPLAEWRSRKARDILKVLVGARGARVVREQLLDLFWPDTDPERSGPRLSVALSTIRAVLDPARAHPPDRYLGTDRSSAWLHREHLKIDIEDFLAAADEGIRFRDADPQRARAILARAEATYRGDFLGEDVYEDWAVATREQARATYQQVAAALAQLAAAAGEPLAAAGYLRRLIERDPWDERAHLALASTLAGAGQHGEARRAYRTYVARMQELEVEAAPFPAQAAT